MLEKSNTKRRKETWDSYPLLFRILTFFPFHIYDWILAEIEFNFACVCTWCGRQYFSKSRCRECCSELKKERGLYPGLWCPGTGVHGNGYSAEYNPQNDTYYDRSTGKTYHHDN